MVSFGGLIRDARANKGLSQVELGRKSNISKWRIHNIEGRPLSAPRKHDVQRLAHALDLDFEELWEVAYGERVLVWCKEEHIEPECLLAILRPAYSGRGVPVNG